MNSPDYHEKILDFAIQLGKVLLRSGAETYRVEDTLNRVLASHHFTTVETFVIPTGIMVTIQSPDFPPCTQVCRIKNRVTRLDRIERLNQLSRDYVAKKVTLEEACNTLKEIQHLSSYPPAIIVFAKGCASAFFSLVFGGGLLEFILAFITGLLMGALYEFCTERHILNYAILFMCSFLIGSMVVSFTFFFNGILNSKSLIIGCITPLLPGVAFTNAVRDTVGDELLSGISRGVEALFIAVVLAAGVGVALSTALSLGALSLSGLSLGGF